MTIIIRGKERWGGTVKKQVELGKNWQLEFDFQKTLWKEDKTIHYRPNSEVKIYCFRIVIFLYWGQKTANQSTNLLTTVT